MSLHSDKKIKNIIVNYWNPDWPHIFEKEASKIKEAIGSNCIVIHHIGSTSVPGLSAKPVIEQKCRLKIRAASPQVFMMLRWEKNYDQ